MQPPACLSRLVRDQRGGNFVEYVLLVGVVALMAIAGFAVFGDSLDRGVVAQSDAIEGINSQNAATRSGSEPDPKTEANAANDERSAASSEAEKRTTSEAGAEDPESESLGLGLVAVLVLILGAGAIFAMFRNAKTAA